MSIPKYILLLTFLLLCFEGIGQDLTQLGVLPRINYSKPLDKGFIANASFFSEVDLADDQVDEEFFPSKVINLTFITGLGYKLNANNLITGGYLFRIIDPFEGNPRVEHRFIQQFVHIQHFGALRLRHHLRAEERFIERANASGFNDILRLSYSLGWDIALQGKQLDAKEFYLNSVSSYFVQPTRPRNAFNNLNEFYLGLGYKTDKIGRFEIGPEAKISVRNPGKDVNALVFIDVIWYPDF